MKTTFITSKTIPFYGGIVCLSTTTGTTGNDDNTTDNNNISTDDTNEFITSSLNM